MPNPRSTLPPDEPVPRRRFGYTVTTAGLSLVMAVVLIDAVTPAAIVGVDSATIADDGAGVRLEVTYGEVSRPALATPFDIRVERPEGFDETVRVAVDREYLRMWDANGMIPAPAEETVLGDLVVWEFDPPEGTALQISYDGRIEPAAQDGRSGTVAVLDDQDDVLAEVSFTTRLVP